MSCGLKGNATVTDGMKKHTPLFVSIMDFKMVDTDFEMYLFLCFAGGLHRYP